MSFILDALKKSEAERKNQDTPGIASIPAPTESASNSKWIWIIAGLLTVNVVVLTTFVLKPSAEAPVEQRTTTPQAAAVETPAPGIATPAATSPAAAGVREPAPSISRPVPTAAQPVPVASPQPAGPSELPTFDELRTAGRLQLPDLHVDIHVYSAQPADRFVFVNMTKYKENGKLAEGPVVTRITSDGVELDYMGTAFLLPRE